jgi:hypothetical protein
MEPGTHRDPVLGRNNSAHDGLPNGGEPALRHGVTGEHSQKREVMTDLCRKHQ